MDRLNYFNPYQSKEAYHEDQLTRAFLVVLKYSFHAMASFYDYCHSKYPEGGNNQEEADQALPRLHELLADQWEIDTQRGNPPIKTNKLLSVFITNLPNDFEKERIRNRKIEAIERNAVYDGVIRFGDELTLLIENKPEYSTGWFDQLNPTKENLSEETIILPQPALLAWSETIKVLTSCLQLPSLSF